MRILISAGDASGDAHSAGLIEALQQRVPTLECYGLGGRALAAAGVELCVDQRALAIGGLVEALGAVGTALRAMRILTRRALEQRPDLVILVDSPDFNLPLAKRLQPLRREGVPILYYISPQVWAWRRSRMRTLAKRVDRLAVIFPFEREIYAETRLAVDFVGHPLVDRMRDVRERWSRSSARVALGVAESAALVALLPGSRRNEIKTGLRTQIDAIRALRARHPHLEFGLAVAPTLDADWLRGEMVRVGLPAGFPLRVVVDETHALIRAADLVLAKPGTGTVEVALLERPLVTTGRVHPLTASLMRRLVRIPSFTMPNLIAGASVVPEFLQGDALPDRVADALETLLGEPARERQLDALREVAKSLGDGGANERAAALAETMLRAPVTAA